MKRVFNLIIVDESGSMCVIEKQALMGLNETLETVTKMQQLHPDMEQRVTISTAYAASLTTYIISAMNWIGKWELTSTALPMSMTSPLTNTISANWRTASPA